MKYAIGLYEKNDTGKTVTLNLLIDLLAVETTQCEMPQPQETGVNRRKCFSYKGFIVGVCTAGDNEREVLRNCEFFKEHNCDFVFSATRRRKGALSIQAFIDFASQNGFSLVWVKKIVAINNKQQINMQQAKELIEMIK